MENQDKAHVNDVLLKRIIDGVNSVHFEKDERNRVSINVGEASKDKKYDDLYIYIRYGRGSNPVRLAGIRGGNYAIVVDVDNDDSIVDVLSSKNIFSQLDEMIEKYKKYSKNHDEVTEEEDNIYDLDAQYNKLISVLNADLMEVKGRIEELARKRDETADPGKSTSFNMAIGVVISEEFGKTEDDFAKKTMKREEASFVKVLDKEQKEILLSKLKSYYRNKIAPLSK